MRKIPGEIMVTVTRMRPGDAGERYNEGGGNGSGAEVGSHGFRG
jgi:hypothetical protein